MVLLKMTPKIVAAIKDRGKYGETREDLSLVEHIPSLQDPKVGNPISHSQVLDIANAIKTLPRSSEAAGRPLTLNELLKGSEVYIQPPAPRTEPTSEYKELMAHLRREEEARQYERMVNAGSEAQNAHSSLTSQIKASTIQSQDGEEEMTFTDVNRQLTLIINVLVTIVACGIAIWLVSSHWTAPKRLALSMAGSALVATAEVAIYAGYIQRLTDAKSQERRKKERKFIKDTWVIQGTRDPEPLPMPKGAQEHLNIKQRKKRHE